MASVKWVLAFIERISRGCGAALEGVAEVAASTAINAWVDNQQKNQTDSHSSTRKSPKVAGRDVGIQCDPVCSKGNEGPIIIGLPDAQREASPSSRGQGNPNAKRPRTSPMEEKERSQATKRRAREDSKCKPR